MTDVIYQGDSGQLLVNNLILTDKAGTGECQVRASISGSWLAKGFKTEYEAITVASFFAFRKDSGKVFSNDGALAPSQVTIPVPNGEGISFTLVRVASQAFRCKPASGAFIHLGGKMVDGKWLELASDGAILSVISDANGDWVVTQEVGSITEQA